MSLFIKTNTRKIGHFEFRKFGVFKSISDVLSILKKFFFMDILAPKVTVHDVKSGLKRQSGQMGYFSPKVIR